MRLSGVPVLSLASLAALCFGLSLPAQADVVVFSQPTNLSAAVSSQNDTATGGLGNFAAAYDNFSLSTSATVTGVQWVGSFFQPDANGPATGNITGFTLSFYSDAGNGPGSLLASFSVAGNAGQSFLANDSLGNSTYVYSAPVNLAITGGTTEWLSIVPDLAFPPQWGWETSSTGDGVSYGCFEGDCGTRTGDQAFSLTSDGSVTPPPPPPSPVPEPETLVLLGTGIAGLAGAIRRRITL